jgi:hypothetical protein
LEVRARNLLDLDQDPRSNLLLETLRFDRSRVGGWRKSREA